MDMSSYKEIKSLVHNEAAYVDLNNLSTDWDQERNTDQFNTRLLFMSNDS